MPNLFSFKRGKKRQSGLVSIHVSESGVAIASSLGANASKLAFAELFSGTPDTAAPSITASLDKANLTGMRCSLVLSGGEYQLLLVEAPEVPANEMKEALLWRVKDLIQYPTDDALLDYFELPEDAFRGRGQMLYVVVAQRSTVENRIAWVESLGLTPAYVDIPEMALLNLVEEVCDNEAGTAVLYLDDKSSFLNILSGSSLYLTRALASGSPAALESTVLDLQRSMDYFESQIGKPPCVRILLLPLQVGETALMRELRENLGADVQSFDLADSIASEISLTIELQQHCLLAIAGALRVETRSKG